MIFEERIEIFNHRIKYGFYFLLSAALFCAGIYLFMDQSFRLTIARLIPLNNWLAGGFLIVLASGGGYIFAKKILRRLPALVLDEQGIFDCTSQSSGVDISWNEIKGAKLMKTAYQSFLVILLHEPDMFILKQPAGMKTRIMKLNHKKMGSPLAIPVSMLRYNKEDLLLLIRKRVGYS